MRAEAASIHGRSSTMTRTARLLVRRRNSVSTAVAVVRGSAARCWGMVRRTAWRSTCRCGTGSTSIMAAGTFSSKSVNPANSRGISDSTRESGQDVIPSCVATAWPSRSKVVLPIPASPSIRRTREPPARSPRKLVILAASASRPMSIGFTSAVSFSRGDGIANGAPGELPGHQRRPQSCWSWPRHRTAIVVERHSPHDRYDGSPSHPAGRDSNSPPPGPNSLFKRGVNNRRGGGALLPMPGYQDFRCGSGNHLREPPCKLSQAP